MPQIDRIGSVPTSLAIKAPCRVATTGSDINSLLTPTSSSLNAGGGGLITIDGVALADGDRVLVKDQTDQTTNGIWVAHSTAWLRDADFDGNRDVTTGTVVVVNEGATNAGLWYRLTTAAPITIGTSALTFAVTSNPTVSAAMSSVVGATTIAVADGIWENALAASSAPSSPKTYQRWIDTSTSPPTLRRYDGAQWVAEAAFDTTKHLWIPPSTIVQPPQHRLTLTSGAPVLSSDVTAATTIYSTPDRGDILPIYNGTQFVPYHVSEMSCALNSTQQLASEVHDVFVFLDGSGTPTLGVGPKWTSGNSRGTGAGTTQISRQNGLWVNTNSITLYNGTTSYSAAALEATYLGSFYVTANGQTAMQFKPALAAGGSDNFLALYNAYNRVLTASRSVDSTSSWTYNGAGGWRPANNSTSNRINFLDGLGESVFRAEYAVLTTVPSGATGQCGVNFNATTGTPGGLTGNFGTAAGGATIRGADSFIGLGLNWAQAMELAISGTVTFSGSGVSQRIDVAGEM